MAERSQAGTAAAPGLLARLIEALRDLWFHLLLLLGRAAHLFGVSRKAARVAPVGAEAPPVVPDGPPYTEANHPSLRRLRRRALNEIFEWLGLDYVPGELLERSDHSEDAVEALEAFLRGIGCDPQAVRRRDPAELERLGEAVDLLMAFGPLTRALEPAPRERLQRLIYSGDFQRLRAAAADLATLVAVLAAYESRRETRRLAAYEAFIAGVRESLAQLPEVPAGAAETARLRSERLIGLLRLYDAIAGRSERVIAELRRAAARLPVEAALAARRDAAIARYEAIVARLGEEAALAESAINGLLGELENLLAELRAVLRAVEAEAEAAADFDARAETAKVYRSESETALGFFGFQPGARPGAREIRDAWRRFMKANHPDLVADPAQKARREERCKEANLRRQVLEEAFAT